MRKTFRWIAALPLTAVALFGQVSGAGAQEGAAVQKPQRRLTVVGQGTVKAKPDKAEVVIGVVTEDKASRVAARKNAEASQAVQTAVKRAGVPEKDIQTVNYSVQPVYNQPVPNQPYRQQIVGYRVSNQVRVTVRKLDSVGDVLDAATASGSNTIEGISFDVEERDDLERQALKQAVQKAGGRAGVLAAAAGARIVGIYDISEQNFSPRPFFRGRTEMAGMAADAATPVQPGELDIAVTVTIVYELADGPPILVR